ncbi:MAG TPA: SDR family NAD(P)-dependent oxidoreductase [Smithellaceae bacterium]|nr:SDR family NAD(P)-dependent oxidoreductase [Smithellaceae bacterium]HRS83343.1 SDR family NAD(P)-dependent oxidoreductase [Smithellaceae bacterium]
MDLGIQGKIGMVTGGGKGIGEAIALRLASEGARVVVADLDPTAAEKVAQTIQARGGNALAVVCDATNPEAVDAMMDEAIKVYGAIDILVNNVGGGSGIALVAKSRLEDWDRTIELNLRSVYLCCRAAARIMIPRKQGRIINMSSVSGKQGEQLLSAYCAAKFGVIGFTETLAKELARHDITVNAVCPGYVFTPGWEKLAQAVKEIQPAYADKSLQEIFEARVKAVTPLRRPQTAEEIAGLVAYLASHEARSITGQAISIDGGIAAN